MSIDKLRTWTKIAEILGRSRAGSSRAPTFFKGGGTTKITTPNGSGVFQAAAGNLDINAITGKLIEFDINNVAQFAINGSGELIPQADNTQTIGDATNRLASISSVLFNVFGASADANPTAQLGNGFLKFGSGGATALNQEFLSGAIFGSPALYETSPASAGRGSFISAPNGANATSLIGVMRILDSFSAPTNYEGLFIASEWNATSNIFGIATFAAGSGTLRPLVFYSSTTEAFRITTAPLLQIPLTSALQIGTTALTVGSLGSVVLPLKSAAGAPTDAQGGNVDGAIVVSSGDSKIYVRVGGVWKGAAVA